MFVSISSKLRFILPTTFGVSLSIFLGSRLFSTAFYNDSGKALGGFGKWQQFNLAKIEQISNDTRKFTFKLPDQSYTLGFQPISFVLTNLSNNWGPWNLRPYTPISSAEKRGEFQLLIKYIPGGKTSSQFFKLKEGDFVNFMGPISKYKWKTDAFDEVNLLCGGTGITPMFQLIRHILENPSDQTKIRLYYANKTENDILLRKELESLRLQFPEKLFLNFYVEKKSDNTQNKTGYIHKEDLALIDKRKKVMFLLCGPDPFIDTYAGPKGVFGTQFRVGGILGDLGFNSDQVFRL